MNRLSAEVRRERLVEAAIRVMARHGVARATTRRIVAEAGMPLGAFHYCFRSKEELLVAAIGSISTRNLTAALAGVDERGDLRDTVSACLRAYWATVEARPEEHQLTYELTLHVLREPALTDVSRRQYERYLADLTQFLELLADAADVDWTVPTPVLARYVHSVLEGLTLAWLADRDTATSVQVLDALADQAVTVAQPRRPATSSGRRP